MNLCSPNEPHALCKVADQGQTMYFDAGEIQSEGASIGFTIMAGCGYDEIIMRLASQHKQVMGPIAYFHAAATNPTPPHSNFTLTIDGKTVESSGIGVVFTNFARIQFDVMVSDKNLPQDGLIDVVIIKTKTALELLPTLFAKIVDHSGELEKKIGNLEVYRGKEITINAEPAMFMEYDGEPTQIHTPFTVRCLPKAARYIVSEDCIKYFKDNEG
jgi:diacylglycerol kinase family enzyme